MAAHPTERKLLEIYIGRICSQFGLGHLPWALFEVFTFISLRRHWQISSNLCNCMHFVLMRSRVTLMAAVAWLPVRSNHTKPDQAMPLPSPPSKNMSIYFYGAIYCGNISHPNANADATLCDPRAVYISYQPYLWYPLTKTRTPTHKLSRLA